MLAMQPSSSTEQGLGRRNHSCRPRMRPSGARRSALLGSFKKFGILFVGVLIRRALRFGVYIVAPGFFRTMIWVHGALEAVPISGTSPSLTHHAGDPPTPASVCKDSSSILSTSTSDSQTRYPGCQCGQCGQGLGGEPTFRKILLKFPHVSDCHSSYPTAIGPRYNS